MEATVYGGIVYYYADNSYDVIVDCTVDQYELQSIVVCSGELFYCISTVDCKIKQLYLINQGTQLYSLTASNPQLSFCLGGSVMNSLTGNGG